jgi:Ca2+-binding EF-hand superfamily protein
LDTVVRKFAEKGFEDLTKLFKTLDDNGDGVLTLKEIQDGLKTYQIDLNQKEWK